MGVTDLDRALPIVLGIEGGFSDRDRAADPGGRTNFGITQGTYSAWLRKRDRQDADVAGITLTEATDIYRHEYWNVAGCDRLPWPISLLVFDYAVNSGTTRAVRELQRALKVAQDGVVGPVTVAMAEEKARDREWLGLFLADRALFMAGLSNWGQNKRGWLKRLNWLAFEVGKTFKEAA